MSTAAGAAAAAEQPGDTSPARRRWERASNVLLTVLGVGFVVVYSVAVLATDLPSGVVDWLVGFLILTWIAFALDLAVRIILTPRGRRIRFVVTHPIETLGAIVPLFRAFRVIQLVSRAPYFGRRTGDSVRVQLVTLALLYAIAFIYFIAIATLHVERDAPGATIVSFGDAIWWAVVTIATVGYGDTYPITAMGRIYAVMLMIGGIAIIGTASATIVSVLNERIASLRERPANGTAARASGGPPAVGAVDGDGASATRSDREDPGSSG